MPERETLPQIGKFGAEATGGASEVTASNPALAYLSRLTSRASRRVMADALGELARVLSGGACRLDELPWEGLRYHQTSRLRAALIASGRAPATVIRMIAALRGVLCEAWRLGLMTADDYQRAADLALVTACRLPRGRRLASGELGALFAACAADRSPAGARDAALLALLVGCGLRRSEAAALELRDHNDRSGELRIRAGKGRRERLVYPAGPTAAALNDWLVMRGLEPGPLFVPVLRGGRLAHRAMTDQAIYAVLQKRRTQAGVRRFSPHDLRRTFVSSLLDAGVDLVTVQRLAGHASLHTTARYDHRGEEAKRRAASVVDVP